MSAKLSFGFYFKFNTMFITATIYGHSANGEKSKRGILKSGRIKYVKILSR